ncbi:probable serine/threonine-protein kinase At1g54610 [Nymphaea colorata]|nr:probable serine/threonine-protein kinase At1g54610 [Nymphaea colorata]
MGCICSKSVQTDEFVETTRSGKSSIMVSASARRIGIASRREEVVLESEHATDGDARERLIVNQAENAAATPVSYAEESKVEKVERQVEKQVERPKRNLQRHSTVAVSTSEDHGLWGASVTNRTQGEQVAAGWPPWLTAVAGEAINGWVPRRADSFEKLDKIGQGTYSNVFRARDLETGKIVALKKVRFINQDPESVRFMAREIHILRRLDHPNVVKLEGIVTSRMSCSLYLVFEYMEHDLAGLAGMPGVKFSEPQIKCYMKQLLLGLDHCHSRGVLHRDIKGSNLLIDNNGILQIADFGLATFFNPDKKQPLTSRVVTLWYRPPELLLGATEYDVAVDLWSTGCILAELLAGKPIMPGRTEVEQLHKIFKLCGSPSEDYWRKSKLPHATIFKPQQPYKRCVAETFRDFPSSALSLLDSILAIEPANRGTAASALKSEFFTTKPLPCDPSSLPKYPPSKEFDVKLRDEARRRNAREPDNRSKGLGAAGALLAPEANAELQASFQRRHGHANPKSSSVRYQPQAEDAGSGFPIEPPNIMPQESAQNGFSHSGPLIHANAFGPGRYQKQKESDHHTVPGRSHGGKGVKASTTAELRSQRSCMPHVSSELPYSSDLPVRSNGEPDHSRARGRQQHWPEQALDEYSLSESTEPSEKQQWTHHLLDRHTTAHKKDDRIRDSTDYGRKKNRIHYSGPLLPPTGNIDEMLKEHERKIQHAVRKARLDKVKTKKSQELERTQFEALLVPGFNGSSDV